MPRATIVETWPGLWDVEIEDGRERRLLTWHEVQDLIRDERLVPWQQEPSSPESDDDWFRV